MNSIFYSGKRELDGPRIQGDPIRRYYFESLDTPVHWHDDYEILYIRDGSVRYHIGVNEFVAKKNELVLVSPYVLHSGSAGETGLKVSIYVFKPDFLCPQNTDKYIEKYFAPIVGGEVSLPNVISPQSKGYRQLVMCLERLDIAENERKPAFELEVRIELTRFFALLYENGHITRQDGSLAKGDRAIKRAIAYIEHNYNTKLTVEYLSSMCGFSSSHFMGLFKKHTGVSCIAYINQLRIKNAIVMLLNTDMSIIQIAEQTGFNSISLFNRTFKKLTGSVPGEYRKNRV